MTPALKPPPAASNPGFRLTRWAQRQISDPSHATWKRGSPLSLLDQGLLSGSNLVIRICFARWMTAPHNVVISTGLRAVERTRIVFVAALVGAMSTLTGGVAAISLWGAPGAATARALGTLVQPIILYWCLRQVYNEAA